MTLSEKTAELIKARESLTALRTTQKFQADLIDRGKIKLPIFLRPCRMKILMVCDRLGSVLISYGLTYFGLSTLVDTLENDPDFWVEYELTKAHRQTDHLGAADIDNFRFDDPAFDINEYDQVWFFSTGTSTSGPGALDENELEILSRWMDEKKGGVFATGDHATLGAALCSEIPRVRNMRKWTNSQGVPSNVGPDRHDTLLKGHNNVYTFDDESDDIPMKTRLRRYPLWSYLIFHARWRPHPVLCGRDGPIDILPDHPHEGEVIVPTDTSLDFSFNGYTAPEYPGGTNKPKPEIIAWARVQGDHTSTSDTNKGPANGKEFGAVGAYDGHPVDVGRVVVDSTWHHWMDVNLVGRPGVPASNPKSEGFEATPAGVQALNRIKNYFLNVAQWLGAPAKQRCMFNRATWGIVVRYPLAEQLSPKLPIWVLGGFAKDAIGRRASQCTMYQWIKPVLPEWVNRFEFQTDWLEKIGPRLAAPDYETFETIVLGGVTRSMLEIAYEFDDEKGEISEKLVAEAMANGLAQGVREYQGLLEESRKEATALEDGIDKDAYSKISARDFLG